MSKRFVLLLVLGSVAACSSNESDPGLPYTLGEAMVIGENKGGALTYVNDECSTPECDAVRDRCEGRAFADVILDTDGAVVEVICYKQDIDVEQVGGVQTQGAQAKNNTVLVLDADDDGVDVNGGVTIEGNNVIIYGQGADVSVIDGDLSIDKNNAIVRGVRIQGDVTISKNNAKLAFSIIEGDVTLLGNNTTLAECVVHGQIHIGGNNTVLVQNELAGTDTLSGRNLTCNGNVRFDDADADLDVGDDELGAAISCDDE